MLSFAGRSTDELAKRLAQRLRERRLLRGWSRPELSARAGVAVPTLRKFEDTGRISLERLLRLALALDFLDDFERLAIDAEPAKSLADFERLGSVRPRQRGRTLRRPAP